MSEFNICGVLVHASQQHVQQVQACLIDQSGVEVHTVTDDGRLVVTIEGDTRRQVADTLSGLHEISGVLSAAMVYQFSDDVSDSEYSETEGEMPV